MDNFNDIERFVLMQEHRYPRVIKQLERGKKQGIWLSFIFPGLRCLGDTSYSIRLGLSDIAEAKAYLEHPVLGKRLVECCEILLTHTDKFAYEIIGAKDDVKVRSSMTLFAYISEEGSVFHRVLKQFFGGCPDLRTMAILRSMTNYQRQ